MGIQPSMCPCFRQKFWPQNSKFLTYTINTSPAPKENTWWIQYLLYGSCSTWFKKKKKRHTYTPPKEIHLLSSRASRCLCRILLLPRSHMSFGSPGCQHLPGPGLLLAFSYEFNTTSLFSIAKNKHTFYLSFLVLISTSPSRSKDYGNLLPVQ